MLFPGKNVTGGPNNVTFGKLSQFKPFETSNNPRNGTE